MALNHYQKMYCEGVMDGKSYTQAYMDAGYQCNSSSSASAAASKLNGNPEVIAYMTERRREVQERTNITMERTLKELARIAYSDLREVMSWDRDGVAFVPSTDLTQDQAAAIQVVKSRRRIRRDKDDEGETETIEMEVRMHSKLEALEKLAKVQGLYQADRTNDADRQTDLLATVLWKYVMAVHLERGLSVPEALTLAEKNPEEVERWGKEVMLIPAESSS